VTPENRDQKGGRRRGPDGHRRLRQQLRRQRRYETAVRRPGHPADPDRLLFTLPRGLADLVSGSLGSGQQYPPKLGAAMLATIPVAIIFVIFQRYFVRDAAEGVDKG
jgi:hypothetical protein